MGKVRIGITVMVGCVGLLWTGVALARDPVIRCQIDKANAAKKREICLAREGQKELRGRSFDTQECEDKFDENIDNADANAANRGLSCRYLNNGDGTTTDLNTLKMWENKDDNNSGGIHDKDEIFTWSATGTAPDGTAFTDFLDRLNNTCNLDETVSCVGNADCVVINGGPGGPCGFAGYRDWRLAEVNLEGGTEELESLIDTSVAGCGSGSPCVDPVFDHGCVAGCTVTDCSCTFVSLYWSSTDSVVGFGPTFAYHVSFTGGSVGAATKTGLLPSARGVRGGR